jgi:hypothetical protein
MAKKKGVKSSSKKGEKNPNRYVVIADGSHKKGKSSIGGIVLKIDFRKKTFSPEVINVFSHPLPPGESSMTAEFHACAHGLSLIKKPRHVMLITDLQKIDLLLSEGALAKWVEEQEKAKLQNAGAALLHEVFRHKSVRSTNVKDSDMALLRAAHHLANAGRHGVNMTTSGASIDLSSSDYERDVEILASYPNIKKAVKKQKPYPRKAPGDKGSRGQRNKKAILANITRDDAIHDGVSGPN